MDLPNEMKGRAKGRAIPNAMQEARLSPGPTQQKFSAPKAIIPVFPARINGKIKRLVA